MHILHVVGARPNFMKAAPVMRSFRGRTGVQQTLVHTGQHYDVDMTDVFFRELDLPEPNVNLGIGSDTHAAQTAQVLSRLEPVVLEKRPDLVLVYGDVNSTFAAALTCAKLLIPVGHVEAGLRSFDRTMPEEINRLLTDQIADLLFTHSKDADENLRSEGVVGEKIHLVGNTMIDTLVALLPKALERWPIKPVPLASGAGEADVSLRLHQAIAGRFGLVTLHRPSNVDDVATLDSILNTLAKISRDIPIIFPVHPRTQKRLRESGWPERESGLVLVGPLGYLDFLALQRHATMVITDSGGIQEETTYLGVPCLTLRNNTERPVTTSSGTNILVGHDMEQLEREVERILAGEAKSGHAPSNWDGHAAERVADVTVRWWAGR